MKQPYFALIGIGVCTALLGVGVFYYLTKAPEQTVRYEQQTDTGRSQVKSPIAVPLLELARKSADDAQNHTSYDVEYPVVRMTSHVDLAKSASEVIETYITDRINEFVHASQEDADSSIIDGPESSLTMRYEPALLSPTIISIRFEVSEYWSGAAHPNSQTMVFNYDLETHTMLATEGLFASSTLALSTIAELSKTSLYEQFLDISDDEFREQVMTGIVPSLENFRSIALTPDGLTVIFDPYQVAPYARGTQTARIPVDQVKDLLTPRVVEAMSLARTNIVEATPIE